jgi:hypothetical protein
MTFRSANVTTESENLECPEPGSPDCLRRLSSSLCLPGARILQPAKRAGALVEVPAEYHRLLGVTNLLFEIELFLCELAI